MWCAREIVGDEPFAVLLPDMLSRGCMQQMLAAYERHGGNVIAVEEVAPEETHQYGIVSVGETFGQTFEITGMVEKPQQGTAPSNFIISGRYILQPEIFGILEHGKKGAGGEIQLTDAMIDLMAKQDFFGMRYEGRTYDTGSKLGFLTANVAYALERKDLAGPLKRRDRQASRDQLSVRGGISVLAARRGQACARRAGAICLALCAAHSILCIAGSRWRRGPAALLGRFLPRLRAAPSGVAFFLVRDRAGRPSIADVEPRRIGPRSALSAPREPSDD